jgi:hypothetical protein
MMKSLLGTFALTAQTQALQRRLNAIRKASRQLPRQCEAGLDQNLDAV